MTQQVFFFPNLFASPDLWCPSAPCCVHLLHVADSHLPPRAEDGSQFLVTDSCSPPGGYDVPPAVCIHYAFLSPLLLFMCPLSLSRLISPHLDLFPKNCSFFIFLSLRALSASLCSFLPVQSVVRFSPSSPLEWMFSLFSCLLPINTHNHMNTNTSLL